MHGPLGLEAPHRVFQDDTLETVQACIACHGQGDELDQVSAWRQSGLEQGAIFCQSCHMPDVRRQLALSLADLPKRRSHSHLFRGVSDTEFMRSAARLQLSEESGQVSIRLSVAVIGHDLPGIAFRQLVVRTDAVDSKGEMLWNREELIDGLQHGNRLKTGETREFRYPRQKAAQVQTRLIYRKAPGWAEGELVLAEASVQLENQ
jgi:hypothetical protein